MLLMFLPVCAAGKYGENCVNDCSAHCKANETCSGFNGGCSGCSIGYIGQACFQGMGFKIYII